MPVPSSFSDISETPSSNSPQGSETVGTIMNQYIQQAYAFIKMLYDGKMVPTAAVTMNSQQINNLANGVAATDAATVGQIAGAYLPLIGGTLSGSLAVNSNVTIVQTGNGQLTIRSPSGGSGANIALVDTASSSSKFIRNNGNQLQVINNAYSAAILTLDDSGNLSVAANITATGNVTAFSDDQFKTNWKSMAKNFVRRLAGVQHGTYDRTDIKQKQLGVSAQSLRKVMPRAVLRNKKTGALSVAYGQAALVASIQVAQHSLENEERIKMLEREIRALKRKVK